MANDAGTLIDAEALIDAGLAQGLTLEALRVALDARLVRLPSETMLAPEVSSARAEDTVALLGEHPDSALEHAVTRAASPPVPPGPSRVGELSRYDDLGLIGTGGMGEVRRVRDRRLGRTLALKTIHAPALARPSLVARFLEEAQATA